jgi:hypothetical protein
MRLSGIMDIVAVVPLVYNTEIHKWRHGEFRFSF